MTCLLAACSPTAVPTPRPLPPLAAPAIAADSSRERVIADGVVHRHYYFARGPWRVDVLDVDRAACWTTVAVKGGDFAAGRRTTSAIADTLARTREVAGAVNADFFLFAPPGVPTNAHIEGGRMLTSPNAQPVFAIRGGTGTPWMGTVAMRAGVIVGRDTIPIQSYNRAARGGLSWYSRAGGPRIDSLAGHVVVRLEEVEALAGSDRSARRWRVSRVDIALQAIDDLNVIEDVFTEPSRVIVSPTPLDMGAAALVAGPAAPSGLRARIVRLRPHLDTITVFGLSAASLTPADIRDAVGGRPILVRDSAEVPGLDSVGGANFGPVRHPRTAVGVAANGRRLFLLTVDGRRPGWSAGMTLREMASLMRSLGATEAINLDGGGSTALVVRDTGGRFAPANRPSDPTGERAVANALAVVRAAECAMPAATRR